MPTTAPGATVERLLADAAALGHRRSVRRWRIGVVAVLALAVAVIGAVVAVERGRAVAGPVAVSAPGSWAPSRGQPSRDVSYHHLHVLVPAGWHDVGARCNGYPATAGVLHGDPTLSQGSVCVLGRVAVPSVRLVVTSQVSHYGCTPTGDGPVQMCTPTGGNSETMTALRERDRPVLAVVDGPPGLVRAIVATAHVS